MRTVLPSTLKLPKKHECITRAERRARANYFLAIRLDSPSLQAQLQHFYKSVSTESPELSKYLIRPELSHVTLGAMYLQKSDIPGAVEFLESLTDLVDEYIQEPPELKLKGIGDFGGNRVVFANVSATSGFQSLVRDIRLLFWSHGYADTPLIAPNRVPYFGNDIIPHGGALQVSGGHVVDWRPHATLIKRRSLDMPVSVKQARKQVQSALARSERSGKTPNEAKRLKEVVPRYAFEKFMNHSFGSQIVSRIELLAMMSKDEDGYYKRLGGLDIRK